MPISRTNALERISRVLAGQRLSDNGEGAEISDSEHVDQSWPEHLEEAAAVLKTLREPDAEMAAAGDADMWDRMIRAALRRRGNGPMPS